MTGKLRILLFLLIGSFFVLQVHVFPANAQQATPTPESSDSQQVADLQQKIADLQNKISDLQGQEKTLSSQIAVFDSQITLTEYRIEATKQQILSITEDIDTAQKKITTLENSLADLTKILVNRIVAGYEVGSQNPLQILLASNTFDDFFTRENYLRVVERHDKKLVYDTVQARNDYSNQKQIFEDKKQQILALQTQLQSYTNDLDAQKAAKQDLLTETQGSEGNYQKLLAQTEAQLASFSNFVTNQGGASLLSNQTACDSWGCYYNQRDSAWGGIALNGTGYSIASDGCLMTSVAMVYTHYGHKDVTPLSINSISSNFSGIPAALLKYSIIANGVSSQRISANIDATLAGGDPIIVGISYDGGPYPDHFVVFVSGSGGSYTMNDPFTPNGHNISFRGRYPSVRIVETDKVVF